MSGRSKSSVQVFARVKPLDAGLAHCGMQEDPKHATVRVPTRTASKASSVVNSQADAWDYEFDGLIPDSASQEEVFQQTTMPLVDSLIEGYNGAVLAYGQTGAGKTHTMFGPRSQYNQRGLAARTLSAVFRQLSRQGISDATVRMSALEIYNETMIDMLQPPDISAQPRWEGGGVESLHATKGWNGSAVGQTGAGEELVVHEEKDGTTWVKNLSHVIITNEEEALNYLFEAETNRSIASHSMNNRS
eukprot:CAMPEP_0119471634 /NCGR_PEP_ID=MMETSP1344-20130328/4016_1 /TAXON_ID=236787 /ORGANISM="Florenciella parvula, Strain CCMP2471" /LENGTH=245 /DNA_ID=CAMNT_0007504441 /DNA_START=121 /DNA_END=855 /DNA_ORIENTATION=-